MSMWKRAALVAIVIGAGAVAWATQQAWRVFVVEQADGPVVQHPDGTVETSRSMVVFKSNDPNFSQAEADQQWTEIKQAIADGNYKLRETTETNGVLVYLYDITLPDGKLVGFGASKPIEESNAEETHGPANPAVE